MDNDLDKIIEGAIALGFETLPNNKLKCTYEQLIMLCSIVASETAKQVKEQINAQS